MPCWARSRPSRCCSPRASRRWSTGLDLVAAGHDGRRLALELVLLALVQAAVAFAWLRYARRVQVSQVVRRGFAVCCSSRPRRASWLSFTRTARRRRSRVTPTTRSSRPRPRAANLNGRLFTFSNNGRIVLWHSAWREFLAHPVVGSGAGGFARWWLAHRTTTYFVIDTHNLYLQTLGELGVVGFGLLLVFLGVPLVAAVRARRHPLVAPAVGAYVAFSPTPRSTGTGRCRR